LLTDQRAVFWWVADGWMDRWMDGSKMDLKDCLAQSKNAAYIIQFKKMGILGFSNSLLELSNYQLSFLKVIINSLEVVFIFL
jgi:hypothetical protein